MSPLLPRVAVPVPLRTALKLNAWAVVAIALAVAGRWWPGHQDWPAPARAALALSPLVPSILYAATFGRWVRHLDELQRRIQLEAWFFAATGTIFIALSISQLQSAGFTLVPRLEHGLGWGGTFLIMITLHLLGSIRASRRYG